MTSPWPISATSVSACCSHSSSLSRKFVNMMLAICWSGKLAGDVVVHAASAATTTTALLQKLK